MQQSYNADKPLGYQQILAAAVDVGSLLTVPENCSMALVVPEVQAVRWRDDGTAPTATVGQPLPVGAELRYTAQSLTRVRFISQVAGAILNVTYYG